MGISVGGGRGKVKNDINVTPLVDVVLVLLIIFIVIMPITLKQITLEVPRKLESKELLDVDVPKQITVTLKQSGTLLFNDGTKEQEIAWPDLPKQLRPLLEKRTTDKVVFVDIDPLAPYGDAVAIMDLIQAVDPNPNDDDRVVVALKMKDETAAPTP